MLWGVAAADGRGSAVDPFSVICHSETQATSPADQTPASPGAAHSQACDHCNLCSATPHGPGTLDGRDRMQPDAGEAAARHASGA